MARGAAAKAASMEKPKPLEQKVFREFGGMNTQAYRTSIKDQEFAWLENVMPIGFGNLRAVPAQSATLQTIVATASSRYTFNVAGADYVAIFCTDGSAYQVLLTTPYTITTIGAAATFSGSGVAAVQWNNLGIVIVDPVKGYFDWRVTAANTRTLIDATKLGTAIAVYAGRVWIANNRTINYTDALSYNSFAGSGGSFVLNDPTLHAGVTAFSTANNFLYIFGANSINVISDVRVVGGVALFSNVNIQSSVGSSVPFSVFSYYRAVLFANKYGFYSLYGSTPQKISDALDGVYQNIDLTMPIYGGAVLLYSILCAAFLFTYNDPALGARPLIAVYHNEKWYVASQGAALKGMVAANVNGVPLMFADDGTNLLQLFSSATASIATKIIPKLFDGADSILDKQPIKFGFEVINPASIVTFTVTIDSEFGSGTALAFSGGNNFTWTNNAGTVFTWTNNVAAPFTWISAGFNRQMQDVTSTAARGKYFSATLTSTTPGYQLAQLAWQYISRADW